MKKTLHRARVHLLIAGLSSLLFGIIVLVLPDIPLIKLIWIFAAYMMIKGFSLSLGAWQGRHEETHWLFLLWYGILNVITGIIAYAYPEATLFILGFIVSVNLFLSGILQIVMAVHLCREIRAEAWLIVSGAVALTAGVYIYLIPRIGTLTILYLIAISALIVSVCLIPLSLMAGRWHSNTNKQAAFNNLPGTGS